ncbi:MAG: YhdH/YhfP family quinone oxidoreductase [Spirochaetaceae bacterium]
MSGKRNFRALRVYKSEDRVRSRVEAVSEEELPEGELLLRVHRSSLNYKDALSAAGHPGVTKNYPHTPGIDAFGVAEEGPFPAGTELIVTGFDLGMNTWGGFGELIRVPARWAVPLPEGLSLEHAAALGTAGLTAGLCVDALLSAGVTPERGPVLVTGATGGVGSLALGILDRLGFRVEALSGKENAEEFLSPLASELELLPRETVAESPHRPLLSERWQGAVDTVGGETLGGLLRSVAYGGAVAACGNAGGAELSTTVYPFILRAIRLQGVDSAQAEIKKRNEIWSKLAGPWKPKNLDTIVERIGLEEIPGAVEAMLSGDHRGRTVIML